MFHLKDLVEMSDGTMVVCDANTMEYIEHRKVFCYSNECTYLDYHGYYELNTHIIDVIESIDENDGEEYYERVSNDYSELVKIENKIYISRELVQSLGYFLEDNKWVLVSKYNSEIIVKDLPFYESIVESLNGFFPNNWWLQKTSDSFNLKSVKRVYTYSTCKLNIAPISLIIKFPVINITNSDNQKHIIKDLYVVLPLTKDGLLITPQIFGFRGSITNIEKASNYYHSHLSNSYEHDITHFCLGSGPLVEIINKMSKGYNPKLFDMFLANLAIYVEWESIEGSPYRRINTLVEKTKISTAWNIAESKIEEQVEILLKKGGIDIDITLETNKTFDVNFNKLESSIVDMKLNDNDYCFKDENTNEYFHIKKTTNSTVNEFKDSLCILDGKEIFMNLEVIENKNTNYKKVLHPNITNYAKKYTCWRINEFFYQEN